MGIKFLMGFVVVIVLYEQLNPDISNPRFDFSNQPARVKPKVVSLASGPCTVIQSSPTSRTADFSINCFRFPWRFENQGICCISTIRPNEHTRGKIETFLTCRKLLRKTKLHLSSRWWHRRACWTRAGWGWRWTSAPDKCCTSELSSLLHLPAFWSSVKWI